MNKRSIISGLAVLIVGVFVLFEVDIRVGAGDDAQVPNPAVEAAFDACYAEKDDEIHTTAFGTIDNPDVQKEFITSNRARAVSECRALHPERLITVDNEDGFLDVNFHAPLLVRN